MYGVEIVPVDFPDENPPPGLQWKSFYSEVGVCRRKDGLEPVAVGQ
jgi:hypothetical protein